MIKCECCWCLIACSFFNKLLFVPTSRVDKIPKIVFCSVCSYILQHFLSAEPENEQITGGFQELANSSDEDEEENEEPQTKVQKTE